MNKQQAINMGANCEVCPLKDAPGPVIEPSNPEGQPAKYIIVGEAPGYEETRQGLPFVGPSGQLLNAMLQEVGLQRSEVHCTNTVLCQPKDGPPPPQAVECCRRRLQHELDEHNHSDIISMGTVARDALLGGPHPDGILATRGEFIKLSDGALCLNTIHPAYVLRNPDAARDLLFDLRKAQQPYVYIPKPEIVVCKSLIDLPNVTSYDEVTFDLETTSLDWQAGKIICMALGFNFSKHQVYMVPSELLYQYADGIFWRVFWEFSGKLVAHNGKFDQKFLKGQLGWNVKLNFDTMLAHYTLDERKTGHGLKELARVYLNAQDYEAPLRPYTGKDGGMANVPIPVLYEYAAWDIVYTQALHGIFRAELIQQGLLDWPFQQVVMPFANAAVDMELAGMAVDLSYVDDASRQFDVKLSELQKEISDEVGRLESNAGATSIVRPGDPGYEPEVNSDWP